MKLPRFIRYVIFSIAVLLFACLSDPVLATEYPGGLLLWPAYGLYTNDVNVLDVGIVTSISVYIADAETYMGFDNNAMMLTSPAGTTRYLFDASTNKISGKNLYLTHFIDSASVSITDGIPPYPGPYRPVENFSAFNGQTMTGIWTLAVYNNALSTSNAGEVTDWSLFINEVIPPTPTPAPTPSGHCPLKQGAPFNINAPAVNSGWITFTDTHIVKKIEVNVESFWVIGANDLDNIGIYLISPQEKVVALFEKHQLSEHALAGTWFDDSSTTNIIDGLGPYVGNFHPTGNLSDFNGEDIAGVWQLLVYNDFVGTIADPGIAYMNEWAIGICPYISPIPTATIPPGVITPTPTTIPITECWDYTGGGIAWTGVTAASSGIFVGHSGVITDVDVWVTTECSASLSDIGIYLVNPGGADIALFQVGDLSDHIMYQTHFDDGAGNLIKDGIAPYLGIYHPVKDLAGFDGSGSAGTWDLMVYNNNGSNTGNISNWELHLCMEGAVPTPTVTPTPYVPPTPIPTPTATPSDEECSFTSSTSGFHVTGQNVQWETLPVSIPGNAKVERVTLKIKGFNIYAGGSLNDIGMYLKSPENTIVTLFPIRTLQDHSLSETWFDDSASKEVDEGISPYIGEWRPKDPGRLSDFYGQRISGEWQIGIYNNYYAGTDGVSWGYMFSDWGLKICQIPDPTPVPTSTIVPGACKDYPGGTFSWSGVGTTIDTINVIDYGEVTKLTARINSSCTGEFSDVKMSLKSPSGSYVTLFSEEQLQGYALYETVFDDNAEKIITDANNTPPYLGSYRPEGQFSEFEGESINGEWTLIVYNNAGSGNVEDWELTVCRVPTPTPSPICTSTPTPYVPPPPPTPILILQSGDYNGDGTSDIGVFRPSTGRWSVRSVGASWFGGLGDLPASGDYAGVGTADISIYRGTTGLWVISDVTRVYFGGSSDTSAPGDYDGDGFCDIGIYRSSSGLWAIRGVTRLYFGASGDYPVPGDYDGDWSCNFAVFRPSSGLWAVRGITRVYFGVNGDLPVPRDYDGDGSADIGIVRFPSGLWALKGISRFYFGASGDYPVPADYDGDETCDPAIFRCSSGLWAIRGVTRAYYGVCGDIPVAR